LDAWGFYYLLALTLVNKALILLVAAAVLAFLVRFGMKNQPVIATQKTSTTVAAGWSRLGVIISAFLILLVVNTGVWQKEQLIKHGQTLFVALEPVDPRSLMQGDYMALRFLPDSFSVGQQSQQAQSPRAIFQRDTRQVGTLITPENQANQTLKTDEIAVDLVLKNGQYILVADAFFFKEGQGAYYEKAKFGEFRIDKKGKALLIGLRDADLKPLNEPF
jgi:uncharacterized membrane-anchored protein